IHRAVYVTIMPTRVVSFHRAIDDRRIVHNGGVLDDHRLGDLSAASVSGDCLLEARISIPAGLISRDRSGAIFLHHFFPPHFVSQIVFGPMNGTILFANFLALYSSGRGKAL